MSDDRQKRIEQRAYEIWDREGRPIGKDAENWQRAEAEIAREEAEASAAEPVEPAASTEPAAEPAGPAVTSEPVAEPVEPVASIEPVADAEPPAKPAARAKTKSEAKPAEPAAVSQARKSGGKAKASEEETQEKGTRKRKAPIKKE